MILLSNDPLKRALIRVRRKGLMRFLRRFRVRAFLRRRAEIARSLHLATDQRAALQEVITHCYSRVPFYRERLPRGGPACGTTFNQLPILTKAELRTHSPNLIARHDSGILFGSGPFRIERSSGSTGHPTSHIKSQADRTADISSLARLFAQYEVPARGTLFDLGLHWRGQPLFEIRSLPGFYQCWNIGAFNFDDPQRNAQWFAMVDLFPPTLIYGAPSRIYAFARLLESKCRKLRPYLVICTYERLSRSTRDFFTVFFDCRVVEIYGTSETGIAAWSCERETLHFDSAQVVVEIVGEDGEPVLPGALGRVLLTVLGSRTQPLLRFDTGDLAKCPRENCACGRTGIAIPELVGRNAVYLYSSSGESFSPYVVYGLVDALGFPEFQIIQHGLDHIEICLPEGADPTCTARQRLTEDIRQYLGRSRDMRVDVGTHGAFVLGETGKKNVVIQRVGR